jgi:putative RecB family exonuclease
MSLLARYMLLEQPATFDPIWREHKVILSYTVDDAPQGVTPPTYGLNITGVLDRLDRREDGKLVVLDYKTGKAPSLKYSARANRRIVNEKFDQLRIYALLVAKELGEDPAEMEIIYLGEPTRVLMEVGVWICRYVLEYLKFLRPLPPQYPFFSLLGIN